MLASGCRFLKVKMEWFWLNREESCQESSFHNILHNFPKLGYEIKILGSCAAPQKNSESGSQVMLFIRTNQNVTKQQVLELCRILHRDAQNMAIFPLKWFLSQEEGGSFLFVSLLACFFIPAAFRCSRKLVLHPASPNETSCIQFIVPPATELGASPSRLKHPFLSLIPIFFFLVIVYTEYPDWWKSWRTHKVTSLFCSVFFW